MSKLMPWQCTDTCGGTAELPCYASPVEGYVPLPAFEAAADAGFVSVRSTYVGRGRTYGSTWSTVPGLYNEDERRADAYSLIRVKLLRILYTKGQHRDSLVDLVAYTCAYLQWMDEGAAGEEW